MTATWKFLRHDSTWLDLKFFWVMHDLTWLDLRFSENDFDLTWVKKSMTCPSLRLSTLSVRVWPNNSFTKIISHIVENIFCIPWITTGACQSSISNKNQLYSRTAFHAEETSTTNINQNGTNIYNNYNNIVLYEPNKSLKTKHRHHEYLVFPPNFWNVISGFPCKTLE